MGSEMDEYDVVRRDETMFKKGIRIGSEMSEHSIVQGCSTQLNSRTDSYFPLGLMCVAVLTLLTLPSMPQSSQSPQPCLAHLFSC